MFLSGSTASQNGAWYDMGPEPSETLLPKRLLLACFGFGPVLSGTAQAMAVSFGCANARTTIVNIPDTGKSGNPAGYDGIFIGISSDGSGNSERAFSFVRRHSEVLSAIPVALFFLLPKTSEPDIHHDLTGALSPISPLDIRSFDPSPNIQSRVADWGKDTVLPLMETGWLADIIFPEPVAGPKISREQPKVMASLY